MLAKQLDMSEANIKRMFSLKQFTLARLEQICDVINISLSDLFLLTESKQEKLVQLTAEQEQELIDNTKLLLVAACARDGWNFEEIIHHYEVDKYEVIQLLAKLDRLKMIQLLPNNKYKVLISQNFQWLPNGPLERFMQQHGIAKFLASSFTEEHSCRFYIRGTYSKNSINIIEKKLAQLKNEIATLNQADASLPLASRQHIGLLLALRPWELPLFAALKRQH